MDALNWPCLSVPQRLGEHERQWIRKPASEVGHDANQIISFAVRMQYPHCIMDGHTATSMRLSENDGQARIRSCQLSRNIDIAYHLNEAEDRGQAS